jgi:DNA-binding transcriptional MerR regulator/methylmalonyl-CoA mutase cobalamin-binding subunit
MAEPRFNIASVERELGLSKDVLRVWERRYGFPAPERDANGERLYPLQQVERLRLIKRLMDQGHRPGRLIDAPVSELRALLSPQLRGASSEPATGVEEMEDLLALVKRHDAAGFSQAMQQRLARQGLQRFVQDTVAALTQKVGVAWEQGRIEIYEEHLFTELVKRVLRQAISAVPGGREPRILLTSLPDEPHALGLLMVEAMLAPEGAHCIPLGTQMPLLEIAQAAQAHSADIVALSFSSAFPSRQIPALLQQLRGVLGRTVELWAGGGGVRRTGPLDGVRLIAALGDVVDALAEWRGTRRKVLSTALPADPQGSRP